MMFLRSVVLGSAVTAAFAQTLVDDEFSKVHGATKKTLEQCPVTTSGTFHHDGMQKDKHAQTTFHFNPPRDGCYLIEERTELDAIAWNIPEMKKCEASANTKVHVHYSKAMQAGGTVDQSAKGFGRQPQDQWNFIAALQFYSGHPGNLTLSNEGTEPGTLTVFDQVRFTWSGKDCLETHAQPRRAEIRMTVSFDLIADRLTIFGIALKKRLAEMAGIPEDSLRLTGLKSGDRAGIRALSVIAELLVLPIVVDPLLSAGHDVGSALHSTKRMGIALSVTENNAELCALSGGSLEGCKIELKDLGYALPTVKALPVSTIKASPAPVLEQGSQQLLEQQENDTQTDGTSDGNDVIIMVCVVAAGVLLLFAMALAYRLHMDRLYKTKIDSPTSSVQSHDIKVQSVEVPMGESNSMALKPVVQEDDKSTVAPSEEQSEPSLCGDIENPEPGMSVVKAMSKGSRN